MASKLPAPTSRSTRVSALEPNLSRNILTARGERTRSMMERTTVWSGGSASNSRLGGRQASTRRSISPTPAPLMNVRQSVSMLRTCSWRPVAQTSYLFSQATGPASRNSSWNG